MRRLIGILLIAVALLTAGAWAEEGYQSSFYPVYSILGAVKDAEDGTKVDGRQVYFFNSVNEYVNGFYSYDTVGAAGLSSAANRFLTNAFSLGIASLKIGGTGYVGIPNDNPADPANGYGADPEPVLISGRGLDEVAVVLNFKRGGGSELLPAHGKAQEPAPGLRVWFGNRLYQASIYGRKEDEKKPFIVSSNGKIKIEANIVDPFQLDEAKSYTMGVQNPLGETKSFDLAVSAGVKASGAGVKPLVIDAAYPEELKAEGDENVYLFTFNAASKGNVGIATSVSTQCAVTVMGGPVRLIGIPVCYPSPVHLRTDKEVFFQYELSRDANIEIYVFDISARIIKRFNLPAGEEGGSAGINKISWNLITAQGSIVSSGIAVFNLIDRDTNRLLGKGKFTALP